MGQLRIVTIRTNPTHLNVTEVYLLSCFVSTNLGTIHRTVSCFETYPANRHG